MYQFSPDALDQKVCLKYSHIFSCKLPVNGNWFSAKLTVRRVSGCESFLLHLFLSCHSCWRSLEKASISGWTRKWRATGRQRRGSSLPRAAPEEDRKSGLDTEMHPGLDRTQAVGRACGSLADTWVDDAVAAVPSLTHVRLSVTPCPAACQASLSLPSPGARPNSCPLSQWCHPSISSSVAPFSCPQSFPASGSFLMSWLFASAGQVIGASAAISDLPVNIQAWLPLGLTCLILQSKGLLRVFSNTPVQKH